MRMMCGVWDVIHNHRHVRWVAVQGVTAMALSSCAQDLQQICSSSSNDPPLGGCSNRDVLQELYVYCAGYKPFQGVSYEGIASAVLQHAIADLPSHLSPAFKSFMSAALTYDPGQRPSASQLLDHPWIQVRRDLRGANSRWEI